VNCSAECSDIPIVFGKVAGEVVVAIPIAYEIQVITDGRVHGGLQSAFSRIRDRSGRQAGIPVGVVGRLRLQVLVMKSSVVGIGQQLGVDDAGIGVERHPLVQAVVVDASHQRSLFRRGGFFFDNRGHRDRLMNIVRQSDGTGNLAKMVDHGGHDVVHGLRARELIGVWKEIALERSGLRSYIVNQVPPASDAQELLLFAKTRLFDGIGYIEHVVSLGNDDSVRVDIATGQPVMDFDCGSRPLKYILAGLE
jgi:hypothetical protein